MRQTTVTRSRSTGCLQLINKDCIASEPQVWELEEPRPSSKRYLHQRI